MEIHAFIELILDNYSSNHMSYAYAEQLYKLTDLVQNLLVRFRRAFIVYYLAGKSNTICIICELEKYIKHLKSILIDVHDPHILWAKCALALWKRSTPLAFPRSG